MSGRSQIDVWKVVAAILLAAYTIPLYIGLLAVLGHNPANPMGRGMLWFSSFVVGGEGALNLFHKVLLPMITGISAVAFTKELPGRWLFGMVLFLIVGIVVAIGLDVELRFSNLTNDLEETETFKGFAASAPAFFTRIQETLATYLMLLLGLAGAKTLGRVAGVVLVVGMASLLVPDPASADSKVHLVVATLASDSPAEIQVSSGFTRYQTTSAAGGAVRADIDVAAGSDPFVDVDVSARWADGRERIFLRLGPQHAAGQVAVTLSHHRKHNTSVELSRIEGLRTLPSELLEQYCDARWLYLTKLSRGGERHYLTMRAARIWFDAAFNLVTKIRNSPIRRDRDVEQVMINYENLAKKDPRFARSYRNIVPRPGYIDEMIAKLDAWAFAVVRTVSRLSKAGKFDAALPLAQAALVAFDALKPDEQANVLRLQRVDRARIAADVSYLQTKSGLGMQR